MLDITKATLKTLASQGGFGDLNNFPTEAITELLRNQFARIIPCTEPGMNFKLTRLGRAAAKVL